MKRKKKKVPPLSWDLLGVKNKSEGEEVTLTPIKDCNRENKEKPCLPSSEVLQYPIR